MQQQSTKPTTNPQQDQGQGQGQGRPPLPKRSEYTPYALIDLDYNRIFYIGITRRSLDRRLREHIHEAKDGKGGQAKREIINDILQAGGEPGIIALPWPREIVIEDWAGAERWWIRFFKENTYKELTNAAEGGPGQHGTSHGQETRKKIGQSVARHRAEQQEKIRSSMKLAV
jgi:hypothetical protein